MNHTITNLSRIIEELEVGPHNDTQERRSSIQRAVYLAQAIGVNLHYPYEMGTNGPYSRDVARDCCVLEEQPPTERAEVNARILREPFATALTTVKNMTQVPSDVTISRHQWMDLLASLHYLRKVQRVDEEQARTWLAKNTPLLTPFSKAAHQTLADAGLL